MKLIKPAQFNQPPRMQISLPHPPERVLFYMTVVVLQDGKIDLVGHINDLDLGKKILTEGMARLLQWHEQKTQVAVPANIPAAPLLN